MKPIDELRLQRLLHGQRWGCLGTLDGGRPALSWVACGLDGQGALLLHLSRLARHTRNLLVDNNASLALTERDEEGGDPQTLARITLEGVVEPLASDNEAYLAARQCYLARLPDAEMLFDFKDFSLFRLTPQSARYVEGFGSSHRLTAEQLHTLLIHR